MTSDIFEFMNSVIWVVNIFYVGNSKHNYTCHFVIYFMKVDFAHFIHNILALEGDEAESWKKKLLKIIKIELSLWYKIQIRKKFEN